MADDWYYSNNGQQMGPVSGAQLRQLAASGRLARTDLVWTPGMSHWAPAESTRGLFPAAFSAQVLPPVKFSPQALLDLQARPLDKGNFQNRTDFRRGTGGMGTGGKVALIGGVIALFLLPVVLTVVWMAIVAMEPEPPQMVFRPMPGQAPKFQQQFGNEPPPRTRTRDFKGTPRKLEPGGNLSYEASIRFRGQDDVQRVHLEEKQKVQILVTTKQWAGDGIPDVDLYIVDPSGKEVARDIAPLKDCKVVFFTPSTGLYEIQVNLDSGAAVQCTVTIEILKN
jgi:hypothetical protein